MRRAIVFASMLVAGDALAICRMVTQTGSPPPMVDPAQSVLIVHRKNVALGGTCLPDAGPPEDAGPGCEPLRFADVTSMVVQPHFETGPSGARFAFLMVTPAHPTVSLYPQAVFSQLARRTAPEPHVTKVTVEDPSLGYQCRDPKWNSGEGCGGGFTYETPLPAPSPGTRADGGGGDGGPLAEPITIGNYEVGVLDVESVEALRGWLDANMYQHTDGDLAAVGGYIERGYTVVAVRVASGASFVGALPPLAFTWEGDALPIPVGISVEPGAGAAVPIVAYVASDERYDVPGGVVRYAQQVYAITGTSYLTRTDLVVDLGTVQADPVATPRGRGLPVRETYEVREEVRIPSSKCPMSAAADDEDNCMCRMGQGGRRFPVVSALIAAVLIALRLRRR